MSDDRLLRRIEQLERQAAERDHAYWGKRYIQAGEFAPNPAAGHAANERYIAIKAVGADMTLAEGNRGANSGTLAVNGDDAPFSLVVTQNDISNGYWERIQVEGSTTTGQFLECYIAPPDLELSQSNR